MYPKTSFPLFKMITSSPVGNDSRSHGQHGPFLSCACTKGSSFSQTFCSSCQSGVWPAHNTTNATSWAEQITGETTRLPLELLEQNSLMSPYTFVMRRILLTSHMVWTFDICSLCCFLNSFWEINACSKNNNNNKKKNMCFAFFTSHWDPQVDNIQSPFRLIVGPPKRVKKQAKLSLWDNEISRFL